MKKIQVVLVIVVLLAFILLMGRGCATPASAELSYQQSEQMLNTLNRIEHNLDRIAKALEEQNRRNRY